MALSEFERLEGEPLSEMEVTQLRNSGVVTLSPRGGGRYDVVAGSTVGAVVLPSLRLLITPKAGLRNVFFLLGYGAGLTRWFKEAFLYESEPDLLRAMVWVFEAEVRRALPGGVVRGYQTREETLPGLRGRVDVVAQLRGQQGRPFPLACRFEEFTEDISLNRVLLAAHEQLLYLPGVDPSVRLRLRAHRRAFSEVTPTHYAPAGVPELTFARMDRHWEAAAILARLVLQQRTIRDREGAVSGVSFTIDMNQLFERFVTQIFHDEARRAGWELAAQAPRRLTTSVSMQPDLVLRRGGFDLAVADAKYKLPARGLPVDDLYQLLAYCVALGLPCGLLIYAGPLPLQRLPIIRSHIHLERYGIDLSGTPDHILQDAREAAHHAIRAASEA